MRLGIPIVLGVAAIAVIALLLGGGPASEESSLTDRVAPEEEDGLDRTEVRLAGRAAPARAAKTGPSPDERKPVFRVTVHEDEHGMPLAGVTVTLWHDDRPLDARRTDAQGQVAWATARDELVALGFADDEDLVHSWVWGWLTLEAEGYVRQRRGVALIVGKPSEATYRIPRPMAFRGVVVGSDEQPVPGAEVELRYLDELPTMRSFQFEDCRQLDVTSTDEVGRFRFDDGARTPGDGKFGLRVRASGYATLSFVVWDVESLSRPPFARIALPPAGVVEGTLVDPAGQPTSGMVRVSRPGARWLLMEDRPVRILWAGRMLIAQWDGVDPLAEILGARDIAVGADGRFRIDGVPLGTNLVLAGTGAAGKPAPWTRVRVAPSTPAIRLALQGPAQLGVRVLDDRGTPLANVHVHYCRRSSDSALDRYTLDKRSLRTNASGWAGLDDITPGPCEVELRSRGWKATPLKIVVLPGRNEEVTLRASRRAARATSVARLVQRQPADPDPEVKQYRIRVSLRLPEGAATPSRFHVILVPRQDWNWTQMVGPWPPPRDRLLEMVLATHDEPTRVKCRVSGYAPVIWDVPRDPPTEIHLETRDLVPGHAAEVSVRDRRGQPVANVGLTITSVDAVADESAPSVTWKSAETNAQGHTRFEDLPGGELRLHVRMPRYQRTHTIRLEARETKIELEVPARSWIHARVVDADNIPVAYEDVCIVPTFARLASSESCGSNFANESGEESTYEMRTDAAGAFRLEVEPGRWVIGVRDHEYGKPMRVRAWTEVDVGEGETASARLRIPRLH